MPELETAPSGVYDVVKRAVDCVLAAVLLLCAAPLLAVCAVAVRLGSPGPVLYRQERVGEGGKVFQLMKLRTMYHGAGAASHKEYVAAYIQGTAERQQAGNTEIFKLVQDPRITSFGRWLRRTSIDELPQLWNVLRGDLSLVGPRPPIPYELEHYQPEHFQRLGVKPGVTGLWQVSGRNRTTFEEMVALDLAYIRTRSLLTDARILLRTVSVVLAGNGA
jgi:lipopolysaccharide/colanic/teichoic acid biosynthesis glycosyltransferase